MRSGIVGAVSTQQAVLTELRRRILDGVLPPGTAIRADELARELGVSRVPIREALKLLEGEGVVTHRPNHGYAVATLSLGQIRELYLIRKVLEAAALRWAVPRIAAGPPQALAELQSAHAAVLAAVRARSLGDYHVQSRRFHLALVRPCGMPHLLHLLESVWNLTQPYRPMDAVGADEQERFHSEHGQILARVGAADVEGAVDANDAHHDHLLRAIEAGLRG